MKRDVAATVGYVDSEDGIRASCYSCVHLDPDRPNNWVKMCLLHKCRVAAHKKCNFLKVKDT